MTTLQAALEDGGFSVPDSEADDMSFWDLTEHALMCFQACKGLPETGLTDAETWVALLGEQATRPPPYELVRAPTPSPPYTNCTALSLITSRFFNGNTVRSFSTHGQQSAAKGSSTAVSA